MKPIFMSQRPQHPTRSPPYESQEEIASFVTLDRDRWTLVFATWYCLDFSDLAVWIEHRDNATVRTEHFVGTRFWRKRPSWVPPVEARQTEQARPVTHTLSQRAAAAAARDLNMPSNVRIHSSKIKSKNSQVDIPCPILAASNPS